VVQGDLGTFASREDWADWVKSYYRDIETYDWVDVADRFAGPEALFHRLRARAIKRITSTYYDTVFLDAGCGTGLNLRNLPPGSVGLDLNPRNIALVEGRLPEFKAVLGDIESMPFEDGAFEGVLCTEVLEHVPNPDSAVAEIWRVLKPGGVFIGSVPAQSPVWRLRFLSSTCPGCEPFHHQYSLRQVKAMIDRFDIVRARYAIWGTSVLFIASKPM
jgi:SAM-dependent methyltransferase